MEYTAPKLTLLGEVATSTLSSVCIAIKSTGSGDQFFQQQTTQDFGEAPGSNCN